MDWALAHPDGQVIISDWRVNGPQPYLAEMGFGYTGNTNLTDMVGLPGTLLDGLASPITNTGWGIYSYGVIGPQTVALDGPTGKPIVARGGPFKHWWFNGFLSDTFAAGPDFETGVTLALRQIKKVTGTEEACCLDDGSCEDLTPVACEDAGGVPQGEGSSCVADGGTVILYAVDGAGDTGPIASLYRLDPDTGAVIEVIGPTGFNHVTAISVHPTTGVLYGVTNGPTFGTGSLLEIDRSTGVATPVGPTGPHQIPDISFAPDGTLYG